MTDALDLLVRQGTAPPHNDELRLAWRTGKKGTLCKCLASAQFKLLEIIVYIDVEADLGSWITEQARLMLPQCKLTSRRPPSKELMCVFFCFGGGGVFEHTLKRGWRVRQQQGLRMLLKTTKFLILILCSQSSKARHPGLFSSEFHFGNPFIELSQAGQCVCVILLQHLGPLFLMPGLRVALIPEHGPAFQHVKSIIMARDIRASCLSAAAANVVLWVRAADLIPRAQTWMNLYLQSCHCQNWRSCHCPLRHLARKTESAMGHQNRMKPRRLAELVLGQKRFLAETGSLRKGKGRTPFNTGPFCGFTNAFVKKLCFDETSRAFSAFAHSTCTLNLCLSFFLLLFITWLHELISVHLLAVRRSRFLRSNIFKLVIFSRCLSGSFRSRIVISITWTERPSFSSWLFQKGGRHCCLGCVNVCEVRAWAATT